MNTTLRRLFILVLVLVASCRPNRVLSAEVQAAMGDQIAFCDQMSRDVVDWCLYQMVGDYGRPGLDYYTVCQGMHDQGAKDACIEQFARTDESSTHGDLCAEIGQQRLRESCYLTQAEQASRATGAIGTVIQACLKAGTRMLHCLNHVPPQRMQVWRSWGSSDVMAQEIRAMLQSDPALYGQMAFGRAVAQASIELMGQQGSSMCQLFGNNEAGSGCQETFQAWQQGSLTLGGQN